jgi:hypothetical protein
MSTKEIPNGLGKKLIAKVTKEMNRPRETASVVLAEEEAAINKTTIRNGKKCFSR